VNNLGERSLRRIAVVRTLLCPERQPSLGESQGGSTITLAMRTPERLRPGPHLVPRVSAMDISSPGTDLAWQLPASTLGRAEGRAKQKREGTIRYGQGSIGVSQLRE
jgi:hypothetical protein